MSDKCPSCGVLDDNHMKNCYFTIRAQRDALLKVKESQWEHRCSDGIGGCTAISSSALAAYAEAEKSGFKKDSPNA